MALTVEDGTGLTDSDAYISLADAEAYYLDYQGAAWDSTSSDTLKNSAIRRAARYLDGMRWKGRRTHERAQSMDWPRYGATDCDGSTIPSNEVPIEVARANALLAFYELANPGGLDPTVTISTLAKREKVDVIEVEYRGVAPTVQSSRPVVTAAMDLIQCLTLAGGTTFLKRA